MIMAQNIDVKVSPTTKLRLEQALKAAGVEDAASVRKLTIDGTFMNNTDFMFVRQYMSETLHEVELGAAIKFGYVYLTGYTFDFCNVLNNITVHQDNPCLASENGVLFNKKKTKLICYPKGRKGDGGGYVIPNSVVIVGINAFYGCRLTSITIPAATVNIEQRLECCNSLTDIIVDPDNRIISSQDGVLFNKKKTVLIRFPQQKQGDYAIPDSVIVVRSDAFRNCAYLTSVNFPDTVTEIDSLIFKGCTGLKSVFISASIVNINGDNLKDCTAFVTVHNDNPVYESIDGKLKLRKNCSMEEVANIRHSRKKEINYVIKENVVCLTPDEWLDTGIRIIMRPYKVEELISHEEFLKRFVYANTPSFRHS